MKIRFLKPAQFEVDDAVSWYNSQLPGLGTQFLDDLDRTIKRISAFPYASQKIGSEFRRCLLSRFPYGIIYRVDKNEILIVAVAHLHRKPKYWMERMTRNG